MNTLPEWTDARFFLELARAGTLSGASRRMDRREHRVGTTPFDSSPGLFVKGGMGPGIEGQRGGS